jgi:hypothetical protein
MITQAMPATRARFPTWNPEPLNIGGIARRLVGKWLKASSQPGNANHPQNALGISHQVGSATGNASHSQNDLGASRHVGSRMSNIDHALIAHGAPQHVSSDTSNVNHAQIARGAPQDVGSDPINLNQILNIHDASHDDNEILCRNPYALQYGFTRLGDVIGHSYMNDQFNVQFDGVSGLGYGFPLSDDLLRNNPFPSHDKFHLLYSSHVNNSEHCTNSDHCTNPEHRTNLEHHTSAEHHTLLGEKDRDFACQYDCCDGRRG